MRIRTIKPQFWVHRMHRNLSHFEALVALALLNYADDDGRFIADSEGIKALCFPFRETTIEEIERALLKLNSIDWIVLYPSVVDRQPCRLGAIVTFRRHQNVNRPQS